MSATALPTEAFIRQATHEPLPAPPQARRTLLTLLAGDLASATITLVTGAMLIWLTPKLLSWAVVNGAWSGSGEACREVGGACWAFLREKGRQILFGIYPPGEHWRPAAVLGLVLGLTLWSLPPRNWTRVTLVLWLVGLGAMLVLVRGGVLGLSPVSTEAWGGLPITLLLTIGSRGLGPARGRAGARAAIGAARHQHALDRHHRDGARPAAAEPRRLARAGRSRSSDSGEPAASAADRPVARGRGRPSAGRALGASGRGPDGARRSPFVGLARLDRPRGVAGPVGHGAVVETHVRPAQYLREDEPVRRGEVAGVAITHGRA